MSCARAKFCVWCERQIFRRQSGLKWLAEQPDYPLKSDPSSMFSTTHFTLHALPAAAILLLALATVALTRKSSAASAAAAARAPWRYALLSVVLLGGGAALWRAQRPLRAPRPPTPLPTVRFVCARARARVPASARATTATPLRSSAESLCVPQV